MIEAFLFAIALIIVGIGVGYAIATMLENDMEGY